MSEYRMKTSPDIDKYAEAMAKAQGEMELASKDSRNPYFDSKYADLAALVSVSREPLAKNGLCSDQDVETVFRGEDQIVSGVYVTTTITHASGQWKQFTPIYIPCVKPDAQGIGSAITYGRRYGLAAALGLAAEDDDGNAASGKAAAPAEKNSAPPKKTDRVGPLLTAEQFRVLSEYNAEPTGKALVGVLLRQANVTAISHLTEDQATKAITWIKSKFEAAQKAAEEAKKNPPDNNQPPAS